MVYFAIDTETTGLPTSRSKPTPKNFGSYNSCRMLSLAVVEFTDDHVEKSAAYWLVKPEGFEVDGTHIHGITKEDVDERGILFKHVYEEFISLVFSEDKKYIIVGHNLEFDINVLTSEFIRHGKSLDIFSQIIPVCTLKLYKQVFLKSIKLTVLYKKIFNKELDNAHDALSDARAAGEIYPLLLKDCRNYNPIKNKKIVIKASEVAACIGMNAFRPTFDVIKDIWKKYNPENFIGFTKNEEIMQVVNSSEITRNLVSNSLKESHNTSDEVQKIITKSVIAVNSEESINSTEKKQIMSHIRKEIYTKHGIMNEDKTADLDESVLHIDEKFYTLKILNIEGTTYEIVGRIDRYEENKDGSKTLVEIKNRTNDIA